MIGIIYTGSCNVNSYINIFDKFNVSSKVIKSARDFHSISSLFIPGVGSYDSAVEYLVKNNLFYKVKEWLFHNKPTFCVCLGFQLLFSGSEEGKLKGFNLLQGFCKKFINNSVPRIEWAYVDWVKPMYNTDLKDERYYFVHSYYAPIIEETTCLAHYSVDSTAGITSGNIYGFQFHPEKSLEFGEYLIKGFIDKYE